ncbi:hypothetical protein CEXT_130371 [Caerostris extrusa]|uniref:Uncharacterized protein n=1 Tax=Caerostris extrusa TaxID=172846 RepID=A0AAV4PN41_CAEEX|nr:hypothetical protein CEXT_130371 [Caerostris extrusa]
MLKDKSFRSYAQASHINNLPQKTKDVNMLYKSCVSICKTYIIHILNRIRGIPKCLPQPSLPSLIQKINTAGSSSSTSKATFGIHISDNPFPSSPTPTLLNRCRRPFQILGQLSKTHAKVVWGVEQGGWGLTIKSRDPKGPKVRLSPQICSLLLFGKCLAWVYACCTWFSGWEGGSSSSISKATFGIQHREPFPSSPTPTHPAKSIPETSDFGPMVQHSREGSLGWNKGVRGGSTIKSRDPKVQKCVSPQICSFITFWKVLSLVVMLLHLVQWLGKGEKKLTPQDLSSSISKATFGIHTRENPFSIQPFTLPPAKSMQETALDFGSMVQDSREGGLGWWNMWWSMIKSRDPKGPKVLTPQDLLPPYQKQHLEFIPERTISVQSTPTPAKSMTETASDFGSMVQDSREGCLEGGIRVAKGSTMKSRDPKGPKVRLSPKSVLYYFSVRCLA